MSETARDPALEALLVQIAQARGFGCGAYKESCLRRRIAVRMRARGALTFGEYGQILEHDAPEYERLLDTLTINVTKFYRNRETWDALASTYVPELWTAREGCVRCWSAGCASGEEPYTVAMLLLEHALSVAHRGPLRVRVDATDFDRASLDKAACGSFPPQAFEELPDPLRRRYFTGEGNCTVGPELSAVVSFRRHDLLRESPPSAPYDLIVCRNVVIYFDRPTQERLFSSFVDALAPNGVLVLGKVETMVGAARNRLVLADTRERIYRLQ